MVTLSTTSQQPLRKDILPEPIICFRFTNCGSHLLGGAASGALYIWQAFSGDLISVVKGHHRRIEDIAVSMTDALVATASADSTVRVYSDISLSEPSCAPKRVITAHSLTVTACQFFFSTPTYLATISDDRTFRIFEVIQGAQVFLYHSEFPTKSLCVLPTDAAVVVGCTNGNVILIHPCQNEQKAQVIPSCVDGHSGDILSCICFTKHDQFHIVTASEDGVVLEWQYRGQVIHLIGELARAGGKFFSCILLQMDEAFLFSEKTKLSITRGSTLKKIPNSEQMPMITPNLDAHEREAPREGDNVRKEFEKKPTGKKARRRELKAKRQRPIVDEQGNSIIYLADGTRLAQDFSEYPSPKETRSPQMSNREEINRLQQRNLQLRQLVSKLLS